MDPSLKRFKISMWGMEEISAIEKFIEIIILLNDCRKEDEKKFKMLKRLTREWKTAFSNVREHLQTKERARDSFLRYLEQSMKGESKYDIDWEKIWDKPELRLVLIEVSGQILSSIARLYECVLRLDV